MLYLQAGIEVWCNGSTTDFGSVCPGSNPGTSTLLRKVELAAQARHLNPSHFVTAPFRGKPAPASLRRASLLLRCLRHLADAPPRRLCGPCGSRFPTLRCKVPRPRRCSDEHFLVKSFGGAFAGSLRCSFASQIRCRSAAPLVRPLRESLSDFAGAKSRDRTGALG